MISSPHQGITALEMLLGRDVASAWLWMSPLLYPHASTLRHASQPASLFVQALRLFTEKAPCSKDSCCYAV